MSGLPLINAQIVYDYLRISDPMEKTIFGGWRYQPVDAIFILGSGSLGPVKKAAELYHLGAAKHIAFTSAGGNFGGNIVFGRQECDAYADELLKLKVPGKCIRYPFKDKRTTNTLQEAKVGMEFLDHWFGPIQGIILCSRSIHQRRAWATFQKHGGIVEFANYPDDELLSVELLPRLVQEIDRLQEYGAKGDLLVQDIPKDVLAVTEQIRQHLKK
jgi:uncharacterized SAM-binding protein YcdF (DUF218 family)